MSVLLLWPGGAVHPVGSSQPEERRVPCSALTGCQACSCQALLPRPAGRKQRGATGPQQQTPNPKPQIPNPTLICRTVAMACQADPAGSCSPGPLGMLPSFPGS